MERMIFLSNEFTMHSIFVKVHVNEVEIHRLKKSHFVQYMSLEGKGSLIGLLKRFFFFSIIIPWAFL